MLALPQQNSEWKELQAATPLIQRNPDQDLSRSLPRDSYLICFLNVSASGGYIWFYDKCNLIASLLCFPDKDFGFYGENLYPAKRSMEDLIQLEVKLEEFSSSSVDAYRGPNTEPDTSNQQPVVFKQIS
ncbi:MAG: hypothetical protein LM514_02490 [Streptococcus sp.]|nr:hypothetical protein [Streptococcus sp.]